MFFIYSSFTCQGIPYRYNAILLYSSSCSCLEGTDSCLYIQLLQPPEYMPENLTRNSAWMGGAILAKVVFPQNQHITRGDYDEMGPAIVHKKCF